MQRLPLRFTALLVFLGFATPAGAQHRPADAQAALAGASDGLAFAENRGQWPDEVLFRARLGGADLWVTDDALVYDFHVTERDEPAATEQPAPGVPEREGPEAARRRGHMVAMRFEGARARRAVGHGRQVAYHNYFLGSDPSKWASHVPLYDEVVLEDLYDGVDLRLYADGGLVRYDLVLAPGADLGQVRFRLDGADGMTLTPEGSLRMETSLGPVEQRGLVAYQEGANGAREVVASAFRLGADGTVGFAASGADPSRPLVIDPLVWSTFLGGTGDDRAYAVAVGPDGTTTVAGITDGPGFPTTPGAYDTSFNGDDAFVTRLSPDGAALLWSTFLGGSNHDFVWDVAVGADGTADVVGDTQSSGFPTTPGAFDTSYNGSNNDAFVARLSADGAALLYSTFLGGTGGELAGGIAAGPDGTATVVGYAGSPDFPTTPGVFDTSFNVGDAFVARLSADGSALLWSTFLGGAGGENALGVAVGANGAATVAGFTGSLDFPTTPGAFDTSFNGGYEEEYYDAFVARLSADGSALLWSTFLGGAGGDVAWGIAAGPDGRVTVAGSTSGDGFPTTPGAFDTSYNGRESDAFVARLSADGSALLWSTFLGGTSGDSAWGVAVGADGTATAAGSAGNASFPTTPGAFDRSFNGGSYDAFVARLSADGAALLYSTFLGGAGEENVRGVALGADGAATAAGLTSSPGFPTTPGAFDTSFNGGGDAFVTRVDVGGGSPGCPLSFNSASITPLTLAPGGSFTVAVNVANAGPGARTARVDLAYSGPVSGTLALGQGTVPETSGVSASVTRQVPANAPAGTYALTLRLVDAASEAVCDTRSFTATVTEARIAGALAGDVLVDAATASVDLFALAAAEAAEAVASPNPAEHHATLAFALAAPAEVRLALYDVLGREVAAVEAGRLEAGAHRLSLDVSELLAGVYVWRLAAGERVESGRLTVTR